MLIFQPIESFAVACLSKGKFWYHRVEDPHLVGTTADSNLKIPACAALIVHRPAKQPKVDVWHVSEKQCGARIPGVESENQIFAVCIAIEKIEAFGVRKYAKQVKKHKADNERRLETIRMRARSVS